MYGTTQTYHRSEQFVHKAKFDWPVDMHEHGQESHTNLWSKSLKNLNKNIKLNSVEEIKRIFAELIALTSSPKFQDLERAPSIEIAAEPTVTSKYLFYKQIQLQGQKPGAVEPPNHDNATLPAATRSLRPCRSISSAM